MLQTSLTDLRPGLDLAACNRSLLYCIIWKFSGFISSVLTVPHLLRKFSITMDLLLLCSWYFPSRISIWNQCILFVLSPVCFVRFYNSRYILRLALPDGAEAGTRYKRYGIESRRWGSRAFLRGLSFWCKTNNAASLEPHVPTSVVLKFGSFMPISAQ